MFLSDKKWVEHPGSFIKEELEARRWTQSDLAYVLGCTVQSINLLVNEKKGISPQMAKDLSKALGVSAEFLSNLQNIYDLSKAKEPSEDIERRANLQSYPLSTMISRGWIEKIKDTYLMEDQLSRFFGVSNISQAPKMAHAAKKTSYDDTPIDQLVWLFRVKQIAKTMVVSSYSERKARELVSSLSELRNEPEQIRHIPRLLSEAGIRFVLVEKFSPKAKIDGACFWLDDSPVIGMSLRQNRIDNFWFVFRHELEHVLNGDGRTEEVIDVDIQSANTDELPEEERLANEAAADFCIDKKRMDSFYLRKAPYISERDVRAFSAMQGVHPGLVVGQIHHRTQNYAFLRKYLVGIKDHILPSAVVDGWGEIAPIEL